ncbi:MAG TPA: GIY-YIG nuclease family protein [Terriglobales bacterium]|nr:GIY-YIG nuclease family protein [Terriglobales bacterium]
MHALRALVGQRRCVSSYTSGFSERSGLRTPPTSHPYVGTHDNDTLFVGLYSVDGKGLAPPGTLDPVHGGDVSGLHLYEMSKSDLLQQYEGRLFIHWGKNYIQWAQNAKDQDKAITEIRREIGEPPFPGFMSFPPTIVSTLDRMPYSWKAALGTVKGVYILVCQKTGKHYVGSASGEGGFWERWEQYFRTGHGGNEGMKLDPHTEYRVSILEVAPSSALPVEILLLESRWKEKLGSRDFGNFCRN